MQTKDYHSLSLFDCLGFLLVLQMLVAPYASVLQAILKNFGDMRHFVPGWPNIAGDASRHPRWRWCLCTAVKQDTYCAIGLEDSQENLGLYLRWQGCSLGLDVSVSRRSFQTSRSRLDLVERGKVSVSISSRTENHMSRSRLGLVPEGLVYKPICTAFCFIAKLHVHRFECRASGVYIVYWFTS